MRIQRSLGMAGVLLPLLLGGEQVSAQGLYEDTSEWKFSLSGWNVGVHGGLSRFGRFLLEEPDEDPSDRSQREVTGETGFAIGGWVGATFLPRTDIRLSFTHTSTDLVYRDDTGTGLDGLDLDGIGDLASEVLTLELTRYLVPEDSKFSPYAGAGFLATWWVLDEASTGVQSPTGSTQFRWGGMATLGVQVRVSSALRLRVEAATASSRNPFKGSDSFVTASGHTIDEPNRVSKTDYRLGLAYFFGHRDPETSATSARRGR
jgi:hypothetical protein